MTTAERIRSVTVYAEGDTLKQIRDFAAIEAFQFFGHNDFDIPVIEAKPLFGGESKYTAEVKITERSSGWIR